MPCHKVLFLDIDGPMIPMRAWVINTERKLYERFDPIATATIKRVLDKVDAKIVISSAWRDYGYEKIVKVLDENGISHSYIHEDWQTKDLFGHQIHSRHKEILDWLKRHPEVDRYVVLDDAKLDIPNLVRVTMEDGILYAHQRQIFHLFGTDMK